METYSINDILWHREMSLRSKALLLCITSLPKNLIINQSDLVKQLSEGKKAIRTSLQELISLGFIKREKIKNDPYNHTLEIILLFELGGDNV